MFSSSYGFKAKMLWNDFYATLTQTHTKCLLCARHYAKLWRHKDKNETIPALREVIIYGSQREYLNLGLPNSKNCHCNQSASLFRIARHGSRIDSLCFNKE